MSLMAYNRHEILMSFPRVSGDEPSKILPRRVFVLFSPRERG